MGKHGKIVMDTTEEFDDEDQRKEALLKVQNNKPIKTLVNKCKNYTSSLKLISIII